MDTRISIIQLEKSQSGHIIPMNWGIVATLFSIFSSVTA